MRDRSCGTIGLALPLFPMLTVRSNPLLSPFFHTQQGTLPLFFVPGTPSSHASCLLALCAFGRLNHSAMGTIYAESPSRKSLPYDLDEQLSGATSVVGTSRKGEQLAGESLLDGYVSAKD